MTTIRSGHTAARGGWAGKKRPNRQQDFREEHRETPRGSACARLWSRTRSHSRTRQTLHWSRQFDPSRSHPHTRGGWGVHRLRDACRLRRQPLDPSRPWKTHRRESTPCPRARVWETESRRREWGRKPRPPRLRPSAGPPLLWRRVKEATGGTLRPPPMRKLLSGQSESRPSVSVLNGQVRNVAWFVLSFSYV